jgi:chaperone BCS1
MSMLPPKPPSAEALKLIDAGSGSGKAGFFGAMTDNPIFGAGVGVAGLGVGLTLLRRAGLAGLMVAQRQLTTSLEIASKDRSYQWVLQWINQHSRGRTQHIGVDTRIVSHDNGTNTTHFDFVPSPGRHYIWYKRHLIQVEREREKSMVDLSSGTPWETVKLTLFGRDTTVFSSLLSEAKVAAARKEEGKVIVYMPLMTEWRTFGRPRPKRPLSSVILEEGLADALVADVKEFHRTAPWYGKRGIPHRRGYLLYGPPGSGKTSFIQALAGELSHNICVLNLNDRGLSDDRLLHLMTEVPPRSFILLEDVDAVFNSKRESTYTVTFSGLLNALDGVTSGEERIVLMTTNHIERLDPALIRPGRVDVQVLVGDSTPYQQRRMFKQFYPEFRKRGDGFDDDDSDTLAAATAEARAAVTGEPVTVSASASGAAAAAADSAEGGSSGIVAATGVTEHDDVPERFVQALDGAAVSMAELQGLLMVHKDQPRRAVEAAKLLADAKREAARAWALQQRAARKEREAAAAAAAAAAVEEAVAAAANASAAETAAPRVPGSNEVAGNRMLQMQLKKEQNAK